MILCTLPPSHLLSLRLTSEGGRRLLTLSFTGWRDHRHKLCCRPDGPSRGTDCQVFLSNFCGRIIICNEFESTDSAIKIKICGRILGLRVLGYTGDGDKASWIKTELVSWVTWVYSSFFFLKLCNSIIWRLQYLIYRIK